MQSVELALLRSVMPGRRKSVIQARSASLVRQIVRRKRNIRLVKPGVCIPFIGFKLVQGHIVHGSQNFGIGNFLLSIFYLKAPGFFHTRRNFAAEGFCRNY